MSNHCLGVKNNSTVVTKIDNHVYSYITYSVYCKTTKYFYQNEVTWGLFQSLWGLPDVWYETLNDDNSFHRSFRI